MKTLIPVELRSRALRFYYANKARQIAANRAWKADNSTSNLRSKLKKYGLTYEAFFFMLKDQNFDCKMCGRFLDLNGHGERSPAVDHDHKTGKVRGILHLACNRALGGMFDDPTLCIQGASYLIQHQEDRASDLPGRVESTPRGVS